MSVDDYDYIPLLSSKPLNDFTPHEYREYIKSMFHIRAPKKSKSVKKKKPFSWGLTKSGKVTVRVSRKPQWLSRTEVEQIASEAKLPLADVWMQIFHPKGKRKPIKLSTQENETLSAKNLTESML